VSNAGSRSVRRQEKGKVKTTGGVLRRQKKMHQGADVQDRPDLEREVACRMQGDTSGGGDG